MNTNPDIIEVVKELQGLRPVSEDLPRISKYTGKEYTTPLEKGDCRTEDYAAHVYRVFPAIAQALLDREEKLKIAVEALDVAIRDIEGCIESPENHRLEELKAARDRISYFLPQHMMIHHRYNKGTRVIMTNHALDQSLAEVRLEGVVARRPMDPKRLAILIDGRKTPEYFHYSFWQPVD